MTQAGFHEVQFPLAIAFGAVGGPERRTQIVQLASGLEHRNAVWAGSRRRFDVGGAIQTLDELHTIISFFEARRGPLHGFRFRDFTDDRSCPPQAEPAAGDQVLGTGDGVQQRFDLVKTYGDVQRRILKPVAGSVVVAVDGSPVSSGIETDTEQGAVVFETAPSPGQTVTAGFEFDCPVRFASDQLEASIDGVCEGRIARVELIELIGGAP
ncbi:MAG: DUF2460 domain-containing protein [Pseudomonadota bacterium]